MTAPTLSTSDPADGGQSVFINKNLSVTFTQALLSSSVTANTVFLVEAISNAKVGANLNLSQGNTKVTIIPFGHLRENTAYRLFLIGQDLAVSSEYLIDSASLNPLTTSIVISFETGDESYIIDSTVEKSAQSLTLEGDLNLPSNVKALGYDFTLLKVRPANHSHNVPVTMTGDNTIRFTFNKALATGVDIDTWATVTTFPILDSTDYLVGASSIPSVTGYVSNNDLVYTYTGTMPSNATINIQLHDAISGLDGSIYGGNLSYNINTTVYPQVFGVNTVKLELKALKPELNDDYIGAVLYKNTIMSWERCGRSFNLGSVPWAAKKFIYCSAVLEIIQDAEYEKFLAAGTRKQVGDMNIAVDNLIGRLAMKIAQFEKDKKLALESLFQGWQFGTVVKMGDVDTTEGGNRLWYNPNGQYVTPSAKYYQDYIPASNSAINRQAKSNNPLDSF